MSCQMSSKIIRQTQFQEPKEYALSLRPLDLHNNTFSKRLNCFFPQDDPETIDYAKVWRDDSGSVILDTTMQAWIASENARSDVFLNNSFLPSTGRYIVDNNDTYFHDILRKYYLGKTYSTIPPVNQEDLLPLHLKSIAIAIAQYACRANPTIPLYQLKPPEIPAELFRILETVGYNPFFLGSTCESLETLQSRLADDFAVNDSLCESVIKSCDLSLSKTGRSRMPYTKQFEKEASD